MALGARLRYYRLKAGISQQDLAAASGVDNGTISALENRDSDRSKFFLPLAKALGLTIDQLADDSADHPINPGFVPPSLPTPQHQIAETVPLGWPFRTISWKQYAQLSQAEKDLIEYTIHTLIKAHEATPTP